MEHRQRRLIAALVLAVSAIVAAYLIFLTPSESNIDPPSPTSGSESSSIWTPIPSTPETDAKRTAEAEAAQSDVSPDSGDGDRDNSDSPMVAMPDWMGRVESSPENTSCPDTPVRTIDVSTSDELSQALESAEAGDRIQLAPGNYTGNFSLTISGEQGKRIWICGPREAIVDSGGPNNGTGITISGSYAGIWGLTISNAQKGIVVDGGDFVRIDFVEIHSFGEEAIRFQNTATDGIVQDSLIHHTGLTVGGSGKGIQIGTSVANWGEVSGGDPDASDRASILRNRIWDTTAEALDIKEGTNSGRIEFNSFDGGNLSDANSWVDVKGNGYVLQGNVGINSPEDGFQTHNVDDKGWGTDNMFAANTAQVSGPGYGFYIQDAEKTNNVVSCTNIVSQAEAGFSNVACS